MIVSLIGLGCPRRGLDGRGLDRRPLQRAPRAPAPWAMLRPAINLAALGLPIYGYTLLASALDHVRWRATLIGSVLTLAGFVALGHLADPGSAEG